MDINAKGVFLGMKYAIPAMQRAGGGAIVNISSISGFVGQNRIHMAYNASKGAVRIMTKSAAVQYAEAGIRVNSVHPGVMPPMRTSVTSADPALREVLAGIAQARAGRRRRPTPCCSSLPGRSFLHPRHRAGGGWGFPGDVRAALATRTMQERQSGSIGAVMSCLAPNPSQ
jgi:NAD(P)-dependent dehydrogenase (short-subunit alcohol dehydrogenase family)